MLGRLAVSGLFEYLTIICNKVPEIAFRIQTSQNRNQVRVHLQMEFEPRKAMFKKLTLGLLSVTLVMGSVSAQPTNAQQGSESKATVGGDANVEQQQEHANAKAKSSLVELIQRSEFAGITLTTAQQTTLKELVSTNFLELKTATKAMTGAIPDKEDKLSFRDSFLATRKSGGSTMDALKAGLTEAGLPVMIKEKVTRLAQPRQEVLDRITGGVTELLTDEQRQTLANTTETKIEKEKEATAEEIGATEKESGQVAGNAENPSKPTPKPLPEDQPVIISFAFPEGITSESVTEIAITKVGINDTNVGGTENGSPNFGNRFNLGGSTNVVVTRLNLTEDISKQDGIKIKQLIVGREYAISVFADVKHDGDTQQMVARLPSTAITAEKLKYTLKFE